MISIKNLFKETKAEHDLRLFNAVEAMQDADTYVGTYEGHDGQMVLVVSRAKNGRMEGTKVTFAGDGLVIFRDITSGHTMRMVWEDRGKIGRERDRWANAFGEMLQAWWEYEWSSWDRKVLDANRGVGYLDKPYVAPINAWCNYYRV